MTMKGKFCDFMIVITVEFFAIDDGKIWLDSRNSTLKMKSKFKKKFKKGGKRNGIVFFQDPWRTGEREWDWREQPTAGKSGVTEVT